MPAKQHQDTGGPAEAEPASEIFDIYDEDGTPLGQEKRGIVHVTGIWHKAVYCFVFNSNGELLIQQRSKEKKIGPGQWDLSVAEHLQPGESFLEAAQRGLLEELGISATVPYPPVVDTHKRKLIVADLYKDFEFVQSFRVDGYDGPVNFHAVEVSNVRFVNLQQLREEMDQDPESFTIWFREEMQAVQWFESLNQSSIQQELPVLTTA